jgi:hypothetical protein
MIIIANVSFPPESSKEIAKKFLEAPQIPEYLTRRGPYVSSNRSDGVCILTLYELDNSKLAEGMEFLGNFYATYFGVPGFMYEVKPHFEILEGLKMVGMEG